MPRTVGVFKKAGWDVIPYPVDYRCLDNDLLNVNFDFANNLVKFEVGFKEWLGLIAYKMTNQI